MPNPHKPTADSSGVERVPQKHGGSLLRGGVPGNRGGGGPNNVVHGIYSKLYTKNVRMQELIAKHRDNPDPLCLLDDLAQARALLEDWLDRWEDYSEALLAWHESYVDRGRPLDEKKRIAFESVLEEYESLLNERGTSTEKQEEDLKAARQFVEALSSPDTGKPRKVADIADGHKIILTIVKAVDAVNKKDSHLYIQRGVFLNVMSKMGLVVKGALERWDGRVLDAEKVGGQIKQQWGQIPLA